MFNNNNIVAVTLFVAQKEILAMGASYCLPVTLGLFDGEDGRMLMPDIRNIELFRIS